MRFALSGFVDRGYRRGVMLAGARMGSKQRREKVSNAVFRKLRIVVVTMTLAGGTLLTATAGGCYTGGPKDVSAEAARYTVGDGDVDAADYVVWRKSLGTGG
jgi:hypothetical protein